VVVVVVVQLQAVQSPMKVLLQAAKPWVLLLKVASCLLPLQAASYSQQQLQQQEGSTWAAVLSVACTHSQLLPQQQEDVTWVTVLLHRVTPLTPLLLLLSSVLMLTMICWRLCQQTRQRVEMLLPTQRLLVKPHQAASTQQQAKGPCGRAHAPLQRSTS
jgi:hypothetical protein